MPRPAVSQIQAMGKKWRKGCMIEGAGMAMVSEVCDSKDWDSMPMKNDSDV
jgi:hypothetical protein